MIVDPSAQTAAESGPNSVASAGETLGKYRLDRVLGAGGMGMVWAAFDPDLERAVAIKVLHSSDEPTLRTRLLREARAMARLKHPNVLTVYEVGTDKNRDYIAMEIVDGTTLDAWIATKPARPEVLEALIAAGRGLAAAHAAGLVHRDFKPHNVLRSHDNHVYVTDFGLARGQIEDGPEIEHAVPLADDKRAPNSVSAELAGGRAGELRARDLFASPLTQTGVMIGTPAYMAPEQFAGKVPEARTDQFAFCVTAWEALSGSRPFRGDSLPELEKALALGAARLPSDLPTRLRSVLVRGLDPDPARRWPDLRSLLDALAAAIEPPRGKSRRGLFVAAGLVVAGGGGAGLYIALRPPAITAVVEQKSECVDAATAFRAAWSVEQRNEVLRKNREEAFAHVFMLDDLRDRWTRAYIEACGSQRTPAMRERIRCLLSVRDETARVVIELASDDHVVEVPELVGLLSSLGGCTGRNEFPFVPGGIPLPALPPEPPEPHQPVPWTK